MCGHAAPQLTPHLALRVTRLFWMTCARQGLKAVQGWSEALFFSVINLEA